MRPSTGGSITDDDRNAARPLRAARRRPALESAAAWLLAILWLLPLALRVVDRLPPGRILGAASILAAPLTLANFAQAWNAAPFARYFLNTFVLVTLILSCQLVLCTLAAYAFARFEFAGREIAFALVLMQLMIMPDVLIVENYRTMTRLGIVDSIPAIALPYVASAFGIFLLRQTFKTVPRELDDAARVEGAGPCRCCGGSTCRWRNPSTSPTALVSVSYHWNNFLWPLIVTNSVEARPLTVGLQVFASTDQGIDWSVICAATLMTSAPLLVGFLLFQRQFVQSFMRAGIRWGRGCGGWGGVLVVYFLIPKSAGGMAVFVLLKKKSKGGKKNHKRGRFVLMGILPQGGNS